MSFDEACRLVKTAIAADYRYHVQTQDTCIDNPTRKTTRPLMRAFLPTTHCNV